MAETDGYCGKCGASQPAAPPPPPPPPAADVLSGINPRTAAILCYIPGLGWIGAIIVLASQRFRHDRAVRFHAFQGLYLFVAWLMADWVFRPLVSSTIPQFHLHQILQAVLLAMSIFMIVKASHEEQYPLPLFGELAQRSVMED